MTTTMLPQIARTLLNDEDLSKISVETFLQLTFATSAELVEEESALLQEDGSSDFSFTEEQLNNFPDLSSFRLDQNWEPLDTLVGHFTGFTWGKYVTSGVVTKWVDPFGDCGPMYTNTHRYNNSAIYTRLGMTAITRLANDPIQQYVHAAGIQRAYDTWYLYSARCVVYRLLTATTVSGQIFRRMIGLKAFKKPVSARRINTWVAALATPVFLDDHEDEEEDTPVFSPIVPVGEASGSEKVFPFYEEEVALIDA